MTRRGFKKSGVRVRLPSIIPQGCVNHLHWYKTASVLAFTELWLNNSESWQHAAHLWLFTTPPPGQGQCSHREDGSGVCLYVNSSWFSTVTVREKLCTAHIKLLAIPERLLEFPQLSSSTPELTQLTSLSTSLAFCTTRNYYHRTPPRSFFLQLFWFGL